MAATYEKISSTTLTTATATITFNSFGGYTDLVLAGNFATSTDNTNGVYIQINADGGNNYHSIRLQGTGTGIVSGTQTTTGAIRFMMNNKTESAHRNIFTINFSRYANTHGHKTALIRAGSLLVSELSLGVWRNTSAMTAFTLGGDGGQTFSNGSTFTLYGILAA